MLMLAGQCFGQCQGRRAGDCRAQLGLVFSGKVLHKAVFIGQNAIRRTAQTAKFPHGIHIAQGNVFGGTHTVKIKQRPQVPMAADDAGRQTGQVGAGQPNAIGNLIAQSDLKDLGVHTEMYVDAFVDIAKAGKITGRHKNLDKGRQVYAFGAGTQKMYDYLNDNPECMAAPVEYTNDIRSISAIDNFISINNAVDIDLFGQVNAESAGIKHISGAGGQLDFVLGAYLSNGGKSFICLSSTFMNKKTGKLESRIRPTLENGSIVTDTRANVHYLCTEYGCVNLKGLTSWEKAEALISVAHPDFRDELIVEAEKLHIWRRSNKR